MLYFYTACFYVCFLCLKTAQLDHLFYFKNDRLVTWFNILNALHLLTCFDRPHVHCPGQAKDVCTYSDRSMAFPWAAVWDTLASHMCSSNAEQHFHSLSVCLEFHCTHTHIMSLSLLYKSIYCTLQSILSGTCFGQGSPPDAVRSGLMCVQQNAALSHPGPVGGGSQNKDC